VAGFLNANSIRPPAEAACTTNIDTYTIGFAGASADGTALNTYALQRAAQLGGGLFAPATNPQTLEQALYSFFANIIQKNRTYGTPSLPQVVTEGISSTGTTTNSVFKAFIASFIPKNQNFWIGHLREYTGSASTTGTISLYDKNGVPFTGNTSTAGQCSFSEYVPPPIWDAGADLSDTTLPACSLTPGPGQPPCYLAPNLRTVYTVTPALLSGFTSNTTGNGDSTWSAGGDIALGAGQLFSTSNSNLTPSDFDVTDTTTMDNIIDYVLGPKQDGIHVLGDIYHSDPTLINTDSLAGDWVQLADPQITSLAYQQYLNAVYNRPQIVVAGADDGMIHAFFAGGYKSGATINAAGNYVPDGNAQFDYGTGQEVWAFIPKDLLPKLQYMYNPALVQTTTTGQYWTTEGIYTTTSTAHVYYVDASPFVRDVYLPGVDNGLGLSGNAAYWHTIMIIGERLGGTYYICLDITNTLHPKFMWEFTTNDMGFTFGEVAPNPPPIGPIWLNYDPSTGSSLSSPALRWVIMLNGGWDPGILTPTRGNAYYVVDIATGKLVWKYDQSNDSNMAYPTAATPIGITQGILGTIHPWWMESFLPDLGGQLWQFSFLHMGDNPPGSWAGSLGSNNLVKTCISSTDTNCFSGQRIFAAQNPPPALSQAQQFYYQPSAIGDPCNDMWIGLAAGNRDNPLSCTPLNYLYEINSPMPYVPQVPLLTASNLTSLTSLNGINSGLCGAGSGWYISLSSFTSTAQGTKSLSIPYSTGGVEYFSVFTPDQNACVSGSSMFSCNTLGGTGAMIGMAIYQIPGTGYKTGQLVFSKSTNQGIPSPPIPVTSIVGTPGSGGSSTTPPTPFTIPSCGTGAGSMALSTQIYGATSEGSIFNAGSIGGANMLMYPILQLCIPKNMEGTFMNPQNAWSSHGGR
jgi:Tfp pilus tip-associated adhesin PilY1